MSILLSFDRQFHVDRFFFLAQSPAQLRQRDVLQLPNTFASHAKFLPDFLERLWLSAIETEALENDFFFAIVQNIEQSADFVTQILITKELKRSLRFFVTDNFAELGRIIVTDWRVE